MSARVDWTEANQRYLMAAVGVVRERLQQHVHDEETADGLAAQRLEEARTAMPSPSALEMLAAEFDLSEFERDLLVLCAGVELDSRFAALCARAQGDASKPQPTFSLALALFPSAHWTAITPGAPLRQWRMIEVGHGALLTLSVLRIDERILHYLAGVQHVDERLAGVIEPMHGDDELVPSHAALAARIAATWSQTRARLPVIQLCGDDVADQRAIAFAACKEVGMHAAVMKAQSLPLQPSELDVLLRIWQREAMLAAVVLLLDCHDADAGDAARTAAIERVVQSAGTPLIVLSGAERQRIRHAAAIAFDVRRPAASEQRALWQDVTSAANVSPNGALAAIASQFDLSPGKMRAAVAEAQSRDGDDFGKALWDACRTQARPRLDDLAQRIDPAATWDDLVLPDAQRRVLREIVVHVRQRTTVYEAWGFAAKGKRGLGISALFAGVSGTGKTMAAEVLANELRLDLYRIDLSAVVNKYIGETEKNLRRVFDAAEEGGAILLFDEADALFGKRSEVKDSHDRYANIEVSYLLQRMEAYRGLAILTTNLKNALDPAFLRRIRFIVHFPFPEAEQRAEIWRRIFPAATPTEGLDAAKLSRLNVAGGNIRNIALSAAFLAADAGEPVRMSHILRATHGEYAKLEKSLSDAEVRGWE